MHWLRVQNTIGLVEFSTQNSIGSGRPQDGRVKGEWFDLDENFDTIRPPFATCSCCGGVSYVNVLHLGDKVKILTNFCGYCGAELEYKGN